MLTIDDEHLDEIDAIDGITLRKPKITRTGIEELLPPNTTVTNSVNSIDKSDIKQSKKTSKKSSKQNLKSDEKFYDVFSDHNDTYVDKKIESIFSNSIRTIIELTTNYNQMDITLLVISILSRKVSALSKCLNILILKNLYKIINVLFFDFKNLSLLIKFYNTVFNFAVKINDKDYMREVINSRCQISYILKQNFFLTYVFYMHELLNQIIIKGDVENFNQHRSHGEISEIGKEISLYLKPLAVLLPSPSPSNKESPLAIDYFDQKTTDLFRNIWFNMVVHGYFINAKITKNFERELKIIAYNSPPLACESFYQNNETSLDLNTVLRRGSSHHNVKDQKDNIEDFVDINSFEMKTISYPKLMFLSATILLESLRVESGIIHTNLAYLSDPSIRISSLEKFLKDIILTNCGRLIKNIKSKGLARSSYSDSFPISLISNELNELLILCCNKNSDLQDIAFKSSDVLIKKFPTFLCNENTLFTLLNLLSLLFESVMNLSENRYDPAFEFYLVSTVNKTKILRSLLLSDSLDWRYATLEKFYKKSKEWIKIVLMKSGFDVKSLLQSYISVNASVENENIKKATNTYNAEIQFGVSFAMEMISVILPSDKEHYNITSFSKNFSLFDKIDTMSGFLSTYNISSNLRGLGNVFGSKISKKASNYSIQTTLMKEDLIILLLEDLSNTIISNSLPAYNGELLRYIVDIPYEIFKPSITKYAISHWLILSKKLSKNNQSLLLSLILSNFRKTVLMKKGMYDSNMELVGSEFSKMEYAPSNKKEISHNAAVVNNTFKNHLLLIRLLQSNFYSVLYQGSHVLREFNYTILVALENLKEASLHPFSRMLRFELIKLALDVFSFNMKVGSKKFSYELFNLILNAALSWFKVKASWPLGNNLLKIKTDMNLLIEVGLIIKNLAFVKSFSKNMLRILSTKRDLLLLFMDNEISKMSIWLTPLDPQDASGMLLDSDLTINESLIRQSFALNPILAINLIERYTDIGPPSLTSNKYVYLLRRLLRSEPIKAINYPDAVAYILDPNGDNSNGSLEYLLYWKPVCPIDAINLFLPPYDENSYVLQYTMRALESHDVNLTFFYVPQIVQALRFDKKGYVARFILETAQISQLFAHQIIWNMLANSYKDEDSVFPDDIKPVLDDISNKMVKSFNKTDFAFYEKEFSFFNEVTSISGKLKPYIKKSKGEKKIKIDEEMKKIVVKSGVYLPSNPDGVVININRTSGKPLQSHAKAPFMATFRIKKEVEDYDEEENVRISYVEKWQSAIFKVGDDCRQDVLALQLISVFRTIWAVNGLDLYVFPYRVTATAPGCGVIDVLPNSISRDMLGREAVNGLYEYYVTKFGPEDTIAYQQARNNLVKSLAAYSIISYLLQFKDRHNGNIMYDDQGHILHIDFGFCFDITPGGVRFEAAPFKLTHEMIQVMGGSNQTQAFKWFEELCVKGYLATRPHMETIVKCVLPMLQSGLPCFKGEVTIKNLRSRFVPTKSEKAAALYMRKMIRKSMESYYTKGYDEFQRLTNGIPY
ncbi:1-phosphatidylinositol 4-kinase STT4 ASCRUDRAFT_58515 [Ascoidea rubescens DSM 1968]|uniref:1-phosphatidylinositol 4-kinase n=1 Tax=Ascoidea rubescens DSM 1968 TaxID=1344418 RepID=A0A1D2VGT6_9ASCO|nr:hypothetical protein ASCRUDRAFT_58515 [Ascoidea rubescens DSM 1968]ODV60802.1 hypothetical protein ASCRUDRAFT_58515 [Ascoidea rubescens DSM 1968]